MHASNVENLIGGLGSNRYVFLGTGALAGTITGTDGGTNILDYSAYALGVTVNLQTQAASATGGASGVTQLIGSQINGLLGGNSLIGVNGQRRWEITADDAGTVDGLTFSGIQNLTAGTSLDVLDYENYASGVTVNLATGGATGLGNISGFRNVIGSEFNDSLTGDANDNVLSGRGGANTLVGGGGSDTVSETYDGNITLSNTAVTLTSTGITSGVPGTDTLSGSITHALLTGGDSGNIIDASAFTLGSVTLVGGAGNDTLIGGAGDDTLTGGGGVDSLDGGGGVNTVREVADTRFILTNTSLDMAQGTNAVQTLTLDPGVTAGSFALNYGGQTTGAILYNASADAFKDALMGIKGIGIGDVSVDAVANGWTVTFTGNLGGMPIATMTAAASLTGGGVTVATTTPGVVMTSTLARIQHADLTGGVGDNLMDASAFGGSVVLTGGAGDDTLIGSAYADVLNGGSGNDRLTGGGGADSINGGSGVDTVVEARDANMTLTNTDLTIGGIVETLSGVELAELTGGNSGNTIDASAFTGISASSELGFLNRLSCCWSYNARSSQDRQIYQG